VIVENFNANLLLAVAAAGAGAGAAGVVDEKLNANGVVDAAGGSGTRSRTARETG
jgi:hypothetical protein